MDIELCGLQQESEQAKERHMKAKECMIENICSELYIPRDML